MKRTQKILFAAATTTLGLMLGIGSAHAQAVNSGNLQGAVDLTLSGTVQSSIMLTVAQAGATTLSSVLNTVTPSTATVSFDTFNTQSGFTGTPNGRFVAATGGAYVVAELTAMATYTGNGGPVGAANINLTLGAGTNMTGLVTQVQQGSPAVWPAAMNAAYTVPAAAPGVSLCPNDDEVLGDCASGTAYAHELAVFVPHTTAGGTTFSQVIHYIATLD